MHCSDVKRETIYIKEKDNWEKDNDEKVRLNKALNEVLRMNTYALQNLYQETYPHCLSNHKSKEHHEYGEIAYQAFGGKGNTENLNKNIIRKIAKEIKIDKS